MKKENMIGINNAEPLGFILQSVNLDFGILRGQLHYIYFRKKSYVRKQFRKTINFRKKRKFSKRFCLNLLNFLLKVHSNYNPGQTQNNLLKYKNKKILEEKDSTENFDESKKELE